MTVSLEKVKEILRAADVEGYIGIHGAPENEYDSEAKEITSALNKHDVRLLTEVEVLSVVAKVWEKYFELDAEDIEKRMPFLRKIAKSIFS